MLKSISTLSDVCSQFLEDSEGKSLSSSFSPLPFFQTTSVRPSFIPWTLVSPLALRSAPIWPNWFLLPWSLRNHRAKVFFLPHLWAGLDKANGAENTARDFSLNLDWELCAVGKRRERATVWSRSGSQWTRGVVFMKSARLLPVMTGWGECVFWLFQMDCFVEADVSIEKVDDEGGGNILCWNQVSEGLVYYSTITYGLRIDFTGTNVRICVISFSYFILFRFLYSFVKAEFRTAYLLFSFQPNTSVGQSRKQRSSIISKIILYNISDVMV